MKNRWVLEDKLKTRYTPIVREFISRLEAIDEEYVSDLPIIDFSDTRLNPYTLGILLESLGYKQEDIDQNGWQMDFWITMKKDGFKSLCIDGTGITFKLILSRKTEE
jgi:hypothetical protein